MSTAAEQTERFADAWSGDQFLDFLGAQGRRYHDVHPFHVRMNNGELVPEELRRWVTNRYHYQCSIPIKDAAILSNCPDRAVRRAWIERIRDHDGAGAGEGGIESWLALGEALGVARDEMESERGCSRGCAMPSTLT